MDNPTYIVLIVIFAVFGLLLLFILFFTIYEGKRIPYERGKEGEDTVMDLLEEIKNSSSFVINDLTIDNGSVHSQIDHLFFTTGGIIVIETKNLSGRIYGREKNSHWTQVLRNGKKYQLYSPLLQNEGHMRSLRVVLKENGYKRIEVLSAIVFVKGNINYIHSNHVYDLYTLKKFIRTTMKNQLYTLEEVKALYELFLPYQNNK